MTVSGLTGFSEQVAGTCSGMATSPTIEFPLSDGSAFRMSFGADGGSLLLAAPGIEVRQTLDAVEVTAGAVRSERGGGPAHGRDDGELRTLQVDGTCT